jgi:Ca-activated chloride channel family protein
MNPLLLVVLASASIATSPPDVGAPKVVVTQPDESKFPEITIYYELKRLDGSFVLDAKRDEFKVTENGQDRPILRFEAPQATETRPTTLVLVVDRSLSMAQEDRIGSLKRAVASFLAGLPKGSRIAVLSFCNRIDLICPFTTDYEKALDAVNAIELGDGTRYYDAVARALELLGEESGRRAVLALTDGEDNISRRYSLPTVIDRARALGLPVHTLGLGDENEIAVDALARLANDTRGQHYLARDADQLRKIYEEIARRIGNSYSLTYQTDRKVPDGTLRPIRIVYQKGDQAQAQAGETAVFIPGMVVPAAGWSGLYLGLLGLLIILSRLPNWKS